VVRDRPVDDDFEFMNRAHANAVIDAVACWALARDDVRAMALVGSWARGNPLQASDIDLLLLTDRAGEYQSRRTWLREIRFGRAGFRVTSSDTTVYGAWSLHIRLLPAAEVELTFADRAWARVDPIDAGTRRVVEDALRIIFDKDAALATLTAAVMSG
jgi:predicted nucleotidyltransferase